MKQRRFAVFFAALVVASCASAPPPRAITPAEQVRHDNALGTELSGKFEPTLRIKHDQTVDPYLLKLAHGLAGASPELKDSRLVVYVIQNGKGQWRSYSLPGNHLYLSDALLKRLDYENEIAALIALQFGHLLKRQVVEHLRVQKQKEPSFIGTGSRGGLGIPGLFDFSPAEMKDASDAAVDLLYQAGFDPRGLISVYDRYLGEPAHSPYPKTELEALIERTRQAIDRHLPLRNPIVRSEAFLAVRKRIKKL